MGLFFFVVQALSGLVVDCGMLGVLAGVLLGILMVCVMYGVKNAYRG